MILEIVDPVLSESDFCAADQPSHQIFRFFAHLNVGGKVETILRGKRSFNIINQIFERLVYHTKNYPKSNGLRLH
jgi:hypothetical protein